MVKMLLSTLRGEGECRKVEAVIRRGDCSRHYVAPSLECDVAAEAVTTSYCELCPYSCLMSQPSASTHSINH